MFQALLPVLLTLSASPHAGDEDHGQYLLLRDKALAASGQRHLEFGMQLRKEGLCVQAAEQIVRAVEASNGQNKGALMVLRLMQDYNDAFWKRRLAHPGGARLDSYAHDAHKLDVGDQKDLLEVASWAWTHRLWEDAHAEYVEILQRIAQPLEFSSSHCITLEAGTLPEKASDRIQSEAVTINERLYVRDRCLAALPQVKQLFESRDPSLCVRSTRSAEEAGRIYALVQQLFPTLEADLGARPSRGLVLVLLDDVALYEAYLDAVKMPENKPAYGFSDQLSGIAVVCTAKTRADELPGVCLHEMTHSFNYGISRASMPSWYAEGLAENYGGEGVFREQDGKLVFGGLMPLARIDSMRQPKLAFGLRELIEANATKLLAGDAQRAQAFYAESWAFVRFLRSGAGDEVAKRFAQWETTCRGALVDAVIQGVAVDKDKPLGSGDLFLKSFGKDLPKLEDAFSAWLATL